MSVSVKITPSDPVSKRIRRKSKLRRGDLDFNDLDGNGYIIHASSYFGKVVPCAGRQLPGR